MVKRKKKEVKAKQVKIKKSPVAFVLLFVAVLYLLVNSIFTVLARKQIVKLLTGYGLFGASEIALVTYAIIWFTLAVMAWLAYFRIDKVNDRGQKWLILVIGVVTIISGRLEAGIILIISAIIYLRQT